MVVKHAHRTIALVVGHAGPEGAVDRELQVVGSQTVSMRVWVGEEATLERDKAECCYTSVAVCDVTGEMKSRTWPSTEHQRDPERSIPVVYGTNKTL